MGIDNKTDLVGVMRMRMNTLMDVDVNVNVNEKEKQNRLPDPRQAQI